MLSRRAFLLSSLGLTLMGDLGPAEARRPGAPANSGPHTISRQDWPPAIVPDHIGVVDRGAVCVSDEFGRLALMEFKKGTSGQVVGELKNMGKRVIDFCPAGQRAYALTVSDSASGDNQYTLTMVSLVPANDPSVLTRLVIGEFNDPTCMAVSQDLICIGGVSTNGSHLVAVYRRGKQAEPSLISTFNVDGPILRMDVQDKHLVVLQGGRQTQIDYVNLYYPHAPQVRKSLKLDGDYRVLARFHENLLVAGQSADNRDYEVRAVILEPTPHAVDNATLGSISAVLDATAQKGRFFVLGERGGERVIQTFTYGKAFSLAPEQTVALPRGESTPGLTSRLAARDRNVYVASGWSGIDRVSFDKMGWKHVSTLAIPRLPASGIVNWDNFVALAGSDLQSYDISRPEKPARTSVAEPGGQLKCIAGAGSYVLCLATSALTLRRIDNLSDVAATLAITGQYMSYDKTKQKAFVITHQDKKSSLVPVRVYSNKLVADKAFDLPAGYRRVAAHDGHVLLCGMNDIALYRLNATADLVGSRHFDHLAVRDIVLADDYIVATAVDRNLKGFLIILSRNEKDLRPIGAADLPQDGTALAVSGGKAVVVGRSTEGKDMVSIVNIGSPATPAVTISLPAVEAASAVAIKDDLAIVVGRGLEILSLS